MTRYAAMFDSAAGRGEGVFGAFLMLGDPGPRECADYLDALVSGGADMVELGIPFTDPVADGPVIQGAAKRALEAGVRTADCMNMIRDFRQRHPTVPVGILTYANIACARGIDQFTGQLAAVGADSLLVADVPSLEIAPYAKAATAADIDLVMIAAPNTPRSTLQRIAACSSGYTYCVARPGVTGASTNLSLDHGPLFESLRQIGAPPPVLGFGISTANQVRQAFLAGAAGVISGSAIVRLIGEARRPAEIASLVRKLKSAAIPATVGST